MRALLWQTRKALGREAWRLRREGPVIVLDPTNVSVDLLAALDDARVLVASRSVSGPGDPTTADEVLERLEAPMLTRYRYEPWAEAWLDRTQVAADRVRADRARPGAGRSGTG